MKMVRVLTNDSGQTVRIPKEYGFDVDEVFIKKIGDTMILTPAKVLASDFDKGAKMLTEDFLADGMPDSLPSGRVEL